MISPGQTKIARGLTLLLLLALSSSVVVAQRGFGAHSGAHFSGTFARQYGGRYRGGYASVPFFWDSLDSDVFASGYPVAATPPFVIVQQPAAPQASYPAPAPAAPLLIELRGGRYVRVTEQDAVEQNPSATALPTQAGIGTGADAIPAQVPTAPPSAILIFRDGRREETSAYTIAGGVLYSEASYFTGASSNESIPILALDVPATVNANRSRGIIFRLPASANEVIVGP